MLVVVVAIAGVEVATGAIGGITAVCDGVLKKVIHA
jgi:hypothetical protein